MHPAALAVHPVVKAAPVVPVVGVWLVWFWVVWWWWCVCVCVCRVIEGGGDGVVWESNPNSKFGGQKGGGAVDRPTVNTTVKGTKTNQRKHTQVRVDHKVPPSCWHGSVGGRMNHCGGFLMSLSRTMRLRLLLYSAFLTY